MAEMKNICGKIPVELHEKVRAEIEEKETSTQIFIRQVIEEHFNRLEGKGEENIHWLPGRREKSYCPMFLIMPIIRWCRKQ